MPIHGMPYTPADRIDFRQGAKKKSKQSVATGKTMGRTPGGAHKKGGKLPAFLKDGIPHK